MSGIEILAPILAGASLVNSAFSTYEQIGLANQSAKMQQEEIREQQVQLRLQDNQAAIERIKKSRQILAAEEVNLGFRNISLSAGTGLAFTSQSIAEFQADEHASKLNLAAKQLALSRQSQLIKVQRSANVFNALTSGISNIVSTGLAYAAIPKSNLVDASKAEPIVDKIFYSTNLNA